MQTTRVLVVLDKVSQEEVVRFQSHQAVSSSVHWQIEDVLARERIHFASIHAARRSHPTVHHAVADTVKMIFDCGI